MAIGFFGGLAEGISSGLQRNQQADWQQKELALQQQGQQLAQERFQQSQYMDLYNQGVSHMSEFFEQWKIAHPDGDIKQAAAAMAPTKDAMKTLLKNMKQNPDSLEGLWAGMIAAPSKAQTEKAMVEAKTPPKVMTGQSGEPIVVDPFKGTGKSVNLSDQPPPTGMSVTDVPPGQDLNAAARGEKPSQYDESALGGVSANDQALVKGVVAGHIAPTDLSVKGRHREYILGLAERYSQGQYSRSAYTAQNRAASVAGQRVGSITVALEGAKAAIPRVTDTSAKIFKTNYPSLNALMLAVREQTGDPAVVQFGIAVNTLVNNYARAVGGGNAQVTDTARKEAWLNLNKAWSQGQIEAATSQMMLEIESELKGARAALDDVTKGQSSGGPGGAKDQSKAPETIGKFKFVPD